MDPAITWFQPEQEGPAKHQWLRFWQTQQELDNMNLKDGDNEVESLTNGFNLHNNSVMNGKGDKSLTFANRRRRDIRHIRPLGRNFAGAHGECPWRRPNYPYARGVIG